jgi:hypothetical protein
VRAAVLVGLGCVVAAAPAAAHLRLGQQSLVRMFAAADGMLVARALEATREQPGGGSETRFAPLELIGAPPSGEFALDAGRPPLRYPADEVAVVLLTNAPTATGARTSTQAGVRLTLPPSGLSAEGRRGLGALWAATHATKDAESAGAPSEAIDARAWIAALALLAAAPEPKLRTLAAIEIAAHAADPEHFTPATRAALARIAADPAADPAVRAALAVANRRLDGKARFAAGGVAGGAASGREP